MSQDTTANLSIVAKVEGTDRAASELDRVAAAGARAEAGANKATEALKGVGSAGNSAGSGLGNAASGAASLSSGMSSVAATAGAAALGIGATVVAVGALANALIPVELAAQKLQKTLNFTNDGNIAAAAKELDYLRAASNRIGLEFNSTASAYVKFAAAAKGTAIEGEAAKRVFEGISKASAVLGLSADETSGALNALQQMVSKGKVQAEELRGQLGERLPGAFQIAARAMGMTTAELDKALESGKVLAEDMLPKLANELEKTFGDSAKKAADDLQGQLNRMQNSWTEFKQIMSKAVLPLTVSVTAVAADALNGFNAGAKNAQGRGWGSVGQFFAGVAGAAGAEMDPAQIRENKLSDLYTRQQGITDQLNDPSRAMYWRMLKGENDKIQAEIDKLESAKRAAFELKKWAAEAVRENKLLLDKTSPDSQERIDAKRKAQRAEFDKRGEPLRTNAEKLKEALETEKKVLEDGYITRAEYIEREKRLREKYKDVQKVDKGDQEAKREAERQQERLNGLLEVGSGVSKTYAADVTLLGKALASGKITTEEYSAAASKLWKTQTESGKAWEASADAADKANKALNVWKAEHESQLAAITEETSAVGQNAAARKVALTGLQVEADARKKIEQLSLNLSETDRAAAVASINAERDKQKALLETALRKQQAVEGAYQLEQENRRFAAESILDEKQRAQVILDIDAETWRQRIDLAEVGSEERRRLEGAFAQWYSNQLSKPAIESMRKALESIDQTFHDSFTRMLENGKADWDAFGKALATSFKTAVADEIYKLTIKPIVVSVVSSFAGGAAQAAGSVSGQSGSGIGGVVQGVQAAYGAYNSGISNAATAFATSGMGQYMGLSTTSAAGAMGPPTAEGAYGYTAGGTALTSSGSGFVSSAGPYAAALAALIYGDNLMKAGWGLDNNRRGYAASAVGATTGGVIAGMAAGASSGASAGSTVGPWGTVIGAVVGAIAVPVLSRLFGHNRNTNADATGVQGTFDLSGFTGDQWQQFSKRGGTFRSDRRWTDTFEVASDIDKALDSSFKQAVAKMQEMGKTLGVEASKSIEGFQHTFSLQLSDNGDMSKAGEKLAAEITKAADEIAARMIPNIDEFKRLGETASETFERLNSEVEGTNAILLAMGKDAAAAFGGVGLASIAARENLIDLAGGLDKLSSKTQSYYGSFYSSDEQLQRAADQAQKALDTGFADLGKSVPENKKAFRDLVESQDLSTEAGRKLFNSLLDLADEFDVVSKRSDFLAGLTTAARTQQGSIFDTFASDAQKLDAAKKIVNDAFSSIGRAVPDSAASFLELSQSLVPTDKASQDLINTLAKVSNAFAYVEKSVADTAAGITAAANAAAASRRSVMDSYDPASAVTRAQSDINAAFARYGATAPTDRAGLAAVANSIDTNTALGREQMAALQALTGAFDTVFAARNQATSSQRSLQDSFDPSGAVARAQSDIAVAFGKYGATAPTDRAGVAAVASSIDTNTALGKQQMAELAALSGAFDTVFSAQERAAQAAADAAQKAADEQARAAQAALDAAQRAADEQARIAQQAAEEQMRLATQVHDSISSALKSLLGQSQQFEAQSRQMAQATLQSALVIAKAGGSLTNFQGLDAALESVTKLDKATFATATSYAVEFGRTANLLTQLEQYTRINGSHANGLDYVPFDGYIAQLHRGERVQTAASAAAADATVEEVKALRSDLNAIGAALAAYTQKTAKLMAKFDVEGIATRA